MTPRALSLLLAACDECGALALRDLWLEVRHLAGDKEFTSAEIVMHSAMPMNRRLRAALVAACGDDLGAAKVGKLFAKWNGVSLGGIVISAIGNDGNAVLWRAQGQTRGTAAGDDGVVGVQTRRSLIGQQLPVDVAVESSAKRPLTWRPALGEPTPPPGIQPSFLLRDVRER